MSPFGQTVIPIMTRALVYFTVSGTLGLLMAYIVLKIMPKPKDKVLRRELNGLVGKLIMALFLFGGIYLFAQTI